MSLNQALGMLFVALGVVIYFLISQHWSRSKKDPAWLIKGEFRQLVRPGAIHVINAFLMVMGALTGTFSVGFGLLLLKWM